MNLNKEDKAFALSSYLSLYKKKKKTESGNLMTFMDVYHYGFYYEIAIIRCIVYSRKRL